MSGIEFVIMDVVLSNVGRFLRKELDLHVTRKKLLNEILDNSSGIPDLRDYSGLEVEMSQEGYEKLHDKFEEFYRSAWIKVGRESNLNYMASLVENNSDFRKEFASNLVQLGYRVFLENGDVENYLDLKIITGVEPDFDEGKKINGACYKIISKNDLVGISRIIDRMDEVSSDFVQGLYQSCIEAGQPLIIEEIKRSAMRKNVGFDFNPKFDDDFLNEQFISLFKEDWNVVDRNPYNTVLELRYLGYKAKEDIVQEAFRGCVEKGDTERFGLIKIASGYEPEVNF